MSEVRPVSGSGRQEQGQASGAAAAEWYGVQDPKQRKKIQDRLAQRARRKRLAEAKRATLESTQKDLQHENDETDSPEMAAESSATAGTRRASRSSTSTAVIRRPRGKAPQATPPSSMPMVPSSIMPRVYTALLANGNLLGLKCGITFPQKSSWPTDATPPSLRPTLLQLSTVHWAWIDRFPFPRFRDRLIIESSGNVDEEEFIGDFFSMVPFHLVEGCESWDPRGWRISREWGTKWGWLFE